MSGPDQEPTEKEKVAYGQACGGDRRRRCQTGMMLAAELALAKVDVAVVEQRPDHVLVGSRAGGFH